MSIRNTFIYKILHQMYIPVREYIPRKVSEVNGVRTRKHRLVEFYDDNYENTSVKALHKYCESDDSVLILGGGYGVTTVHAARCASDVVCYEAAKSQYDIVSNTIEREGVQDIVSIHHKLVCENSDVYDENVGQNISPADLPVCDVWEVDIEGAELSLINNLPYYPRVLIIEAHPQYNSPADKICSKLKKYGYSIQRGERKGSTETIVGLRDSGRS